MKNLLLFIASIYFINAFSQVGPLVQYPFNGNANDIGPNAQHGTVFGATLTTDRFNNPNSAYYFDGINDYISIPTTGLIGLNLYSYSFWIKPQNVPTGNDAYIPISVGGNSDPWTQAASFKSNSRVFAGSYNIGSNPVQSYSESQVLAPNQWIHVVFTRSNSELKLYINGQQISSTVMSATNNQTANYGTNPVANIGARSNLDPNFNFYGALDDFVLFNREITPCEVNDLYLGNTIGDTTKIIVYDTVQVTIYDTVQVAVYDTVRIAVTDTLIINLKPNGINTPGNDNRLTIYPNPTLDQVIINTGNFGIMSNHTIKITNSLGQTVFQNLVNQQQFNISMSTLGPVGTYFVFIYDDQMNMLDVRKIILQ